MANVDWHKGWAESGKVLDVGWNRNASLSLVSILPSASFVAPYDKILIVCASFIFDLDTPFDSAHRDPSYEALSTSI